MLDVDDLPSELAPANGEPAEAAGTDGLHELVGQAAVGDRGPVHRRDAQSHRAATARRRPKMLGIGERTLYRKIKEYGLN